MKEVKRTWMMVGLVVLCLFAFGWAEEDKQKNLSLEERIAKLVKPARRPLIPEEAKWMAELIAKALSPKERGKPSLTREEAIFALGDEIGHVAVIPILEQIARDREEYKFISENSSNELSEGSR